MGNHQQINSVITGGGGQGQIKVRNFMALLDQKYRQGVRPEASDADMSEIPRTGGNGVIGINLGAKGSLQVTENYIAPVFKIEKVIRP